MLERFKQLVADYYNRHSEKTDGAAITADDVYVVWSWLNEGRVSGGCSTCSDLRKFIHR